MTHPLQIGNLLVKVDHVTKRFPGVVALDRASLEIRRGEVHGLVGENGAGKSTLIKLLSGVYQPDEGNIFVRGQQVAISHPSRAQGLGITTIYQENTLVPDLSLVENVFLGREIHRLGPLLNKEAMLARTKELWQTFGGDPADVHRLVSELGGLKQRLIEIVKALAFDAELVIMDEPTAALPDGERAKLLAHIRQLAAGGVSVLLVTHRLEELFGVADQVTIFRDGCWVATMPISETSIDDVIRKMVGRQVDSIAAIAHRAPGMSLSKDAPEVLRATGLSRRGVLHDVSLTVQSGEIVGLGGLAGSGRTELGRAIIGADRLDCGQVMLAGHRVTLNSPADGVRAGIAMVPEERKTLGILAGFSVARNITIGAIRKIAAGFFLRSRQEQAVALNFVAKLRIKTRSTRERIENLSGGNQQKVLFARALFGEPKLLIVDEPTQGIDVGAKPEIYRLIRQFVSKGGAALVISSELSELLDLSDRVVVLRDGTKIGELLVPQESIHSPELKDRLKQQVLQLATGSSSDQ